MKVGYMTGVLMGDTQADAEQNVSYKPKETFTEETDNNELKDGVEESNENGGTYTFLNTKMIAYVVIGLVLFKYFKK
jgi:hypothetical protein